VTNNDLQKWSHGLNNTLLCLKVIFYELEKIPEFDNLKEIYRAGINQLDDLSKELKTAAMTSTQKEEGSDEQ
jgi:hypothetical protein